MNTAFGHWLAGLVDGEGCFSLSPKGLHKTVITPRFMIVLRADDLPILEEIRSFIGYGRFHFNPRRPSDTSKTNPRWNYNVETIAGCVKVSDVFTEFPLRAKKRKDFEIWREAVKFKAAHPLRPGFANAATKEERLLVHQTMASYLVRLKAAREYVHNT